MARTLSPQACHNQSEMGWGMPAAEKRQFMLTACSAHKAPSVFHKIKTLVVDANAVGGGGRHCCGAAAY